MSAPYVPIKRLVDNSLAAIGTGAWVGDSLSHAACAVVGSMIISYSTGVDRPSRSCRRRR